MSDQVDRTYRDDELDAARRDLAESERDKGLPPATTADSRLDGPGLLVRGQR